MKGFFVTGTDTDVGKTAVTAALARLLSGRFRVGVFKPVQTGVTDLSRSDAAYLYQASGYDGPFEDTFAYSFPEPVAPGLAAAYARTTISREFIREKYDRVKDRADVILVEGAGGLMVPVADGLLMADIALDCNLPLLIVARPDLGTINHTLLTVHTARSLGIPVRGVIINGFFEKSCGPDISETVNMIQKYGAVDVLGVIPRFDDPEPMPVIDRISRWMESENIRSIL